jgi:site-specific DNA recombinase
MVMKKTIGYCRCSTEEQATTGHSLEVQKARIEAYAQAYGLTLDEFVVDAGISAKSLNRPGIQGLMARVKRGEVGSVIVFKLDRISRAIVDLASLVETFNKYDTSFVSVSEQLDTGSACGRLMVNLLGVLSQFEREQISERVTTTLGHLRTSGKVYSGSTPYGYAPMTTSSGVQQLVADDEQQKVLCDIHDMRTGGMGYARIAAVLNEQEVPARNGGKWYASSVHSVLNSRMATLSVCTA